MGGTALWIEVARLVEGRALRRVATAVVTLGVTCLWAACPEQAWAQAPPVGDRPSALGVPPQAPGAVRIDVAKLILGAPGSEASFSMLLATPGWLPPNSYVRIQGLPSQVTLSDGHAIAPGAWAVPITALPHLRIVIPDGVAGRSEVSIALVSIDAGTIAEARTMLVVAGAALSGVPPGSDAKPPTPPQGASSSPPVASEPEAKAASAIAIVPVAPPPATSQPAATPPAAPPPSPSPPPASQPPAAKSEPPVPRPTAPAAAPQDLERGRAFHMRGQALLGGGDVASARQFFLRAAEAGVWEGALAMGTTYDAVELANRRTLGVRPDAAEAKRWYERARELGGGTTAERHLARLASP